MGLAYRDKEPYVLSRSVQSNQPNQMDVVGLWEEALGENPRWPGRNMQTPQRKAPWGIQTRTLQEIAASPE